MSKSPVKLSACLSVIHAAQQHVDKYPSVAEPTETVTAEMRTACKFVTRIANQLNGLSEFSAQQAAAAALGMPAAFSTSAFAYVFPHAALRHVRLSQLASSTATDGEDGSSTGGGEGDTSSDDDEGVPNPGSDAEPQRPSAVCGAGGGTGTATTYNVNGVIVTVPQHDHYRFRGPVLQTYCLYEYGGLVSIVPKSRKEQPVDPDAVTDGRGRKPSPKFDFHEQHPLYATHTQTLRSKHVTPILAGRACEAYPGDRPDVPTKAWEEQAAKFAAYMLTTFKPWDSDTLLPGDLSWDAFCKYMIELERGSAGPPAVPPTFVGRSRAGIIHNVATGLRTSSERMFMSSAYRSRAADLLLKKAWAGDGNAVMGREQVEGEATDEIARMVSEAEGNQRGLTQQLMQQYIDKSLDAVSLALGEPAAPTACRATDSSVCKTSEAEVTAMVDGIYTRDPVVQPATVPPPAPAAGGAGGGVPATPVDVTAGANEKQLEGVRRVVEYVKLLQAHRADSAVPQPDQLQLFVTGGPGVGKSFFVRVLDDAITAIGSKLTGAAFTGCAATQLPRPQTLHTLLNFGGRKKKKGGKQKEETGGEDLPKLSRPELLKLQQRLQDVDVFLIDEVRHWL